VGVITVETAPTVTVDNGSTTPIGSAGAGTVPFVINNLSLDDSGTLTFTDGTNVVTVQISGGTVEAGPNNTATTVNLQSLSDGTITSTLTLDSSNNNPFYTTGGNSVTLDQDLNELPIVTVDFGSPLVDKADAAAVAFSVSGAESDDSGTLTFSDGTHTATVTITGGDTTGTVNLSSFNDNTPITSTLALTDTAGNSFSASGNDVTLIPPSESGIGGLLTSVFWRQTGGALADWEMDGSVISSSGLPTYQGKAITPDSTWSIAGVGDFTGSGNADLLWRQSTTGLVAEWLMNGSTITSGAAITYQGKAITPDSSWGVVGVGDFNGDGDSDILWRQSTTGSVTDWQMNGSTVTSGAAVTYHGSAVKADSSWSVAGVGDFNGEGDADVLWRQSSTGNLQEWLMNGSTIESTSPLTYQGNAVTPNSSWSVAGVGDFNGDGKADLVWRQGSTGTLAMWLMNGSTIESTATITYQGNAVKPDSSWSIVDIGDFTGNNAESDILWRQSTTGVLAEWQMNGAQIVSSQEVTSLGSPVTPNNSWQVQNKPTNFV
jgi:FG-GAP-like repeat